MKKIVIFGSTGNIGAYFTDYCNNMIDKKQYEVIAVGRKHTDYYKKAGIEYIMWIYVMHQILRGCQQKICMLLLI